MPRIVYVNGRYVPYAEASVHVEDRGFQLADAVYEVCEVRDGRLVDEDRHMARLARSLKEISIAKPMSDRALGLVIRRTIALNRVRRGSIYLQVTRGIAPRDFPFPVPAVAPTVVVIARMGNPERQQAQAATGISVKTVSDIRWGRRDIKTVMLLPACLAKEAAKAEGAREAWLVDGEGFVTEGAASNAWIVDANGTLITRPTDTVILAGVTRATTLDAIQREGLQLELRAFTREEAFAAREAFITSATNLVMPVVAIDGKQVGDGGPGPVAQRLRSIFNHVAELSPAALRQISPLA